MLKSIFFYKASFEAQHTSRVDIVYIKFNCMNYNNNEGIYFLRIYPPRVAFHWTA